MKQENLKNLSTYIEESIGEKGHDISNPSYCSLYLAIFFDELKANGGPLHTDKFLHQLNTIKGDKRKKDKALEKFNLVWSSWVELYRELKKRDMV